MFTRSYTAGSVPAAGRPASLIRPLLTVSKPEEGKNGRLGGVVPKLLAKVIKYSYRPFKTDVDICVFVVSVAFEMLSLTTVVAARFARSATR